MPERSQRRDALLLQSLREAVAELTDQLGSDIDRSQYGQNDYKHVLIKHPMSAAVHLELRDRLDVGPWPRGATVTHRITRAGETTKPPRRRSERAVSCELRTHSP